MPDTDDIKTQALGIAVSLAERSNIVSTVAGLVADAAEIEKYLRAAPAPAAPAEPFTMPAVDDDYDPHERSTVTDFVGKEIYVEIDRDNDLLIWHETEGSFYLRSKDEARKLATAILARASYIRPGTS